MKHEVSSERHYPQPIEDVWTGLTTSAALSEWFMESRGFAPEVGCEFEFTCINDDGDRDIYKCEVLELEPPTRMLWSWVLDSRAAPIKMEVEFQLVALANGTKLTVFHRSDRDPQSLERFRLGWPAPLDRLEALVDHR